MWSADAYCPKGAPSVGGGFEAGPFTQEGPYPFESYRIKGRAWRATAGSAENATTSGSVSSFALCQRGARKLMPVVAETGVGVVGTPATLPVNVDVNCPGKLRSVAGGFRGDADVTEGVSLPQDSYKTSQRGWRNSGFALGDPNSATERSFTSIGYCSRQGRAVTTGAADVLAAPDLSSALSNTCSPRRRLLGGFAVAPIAQDRVLGVMVSKPSGSSWEAAATNLFGAAPGSISAFGYCR